MRHQPLWNDNLLYPAQLDRSAFGALWPGGGGAGASPSALANTMDTSIPPGWLAVPLQTGQGSALCRWDAVEVVTHPVAPAYGQQRWDAVVCQVRDAAIDGGANNDFIFAVVPGDPAVSGPVIPAVPANAALVALLIVPGDAANLNGAPFFDRRPLGHCEVYQSGAQAMPNSAFAQIQYDRVEAGAGWGFGAFSCPMPGRYLVSATYMADRPLSLQGLAVRRNGSEVKRGSSINPPASASFPSVNMAVVVPGCNVNDALSIWGAGSPAHNTYVTGGPSAFNFASFQYLGP